MTPKLTDFDSDTGQRVVVEHPSAPSTFGWSLPIWCGVLLLTPIRVWYWMRGQK